MRLRVLGILSLFSVVVVIAVSASILASVGRELTQELQINRVAALNRFAQVANDAVGSGDTAQLQREMDRYSALYGEGVLVKLPHGTLASGGLAAERADVQDSLSRAGLNLNDTTLASVVPLGPHSEVLARSFGTASQVLGEAVLDVDLTAAEQKLRERWLLVVLGAIALWALLLVGAERLSVWVLRPVQRLTAAVVAFEESGRATPLREDGPPELQRLSRAFSTMAEHVGESMQAQRQLIADASHQLRNPIGALRLRTDLLALELSTPAQRTAAAGVTRELEHVEELLDGILRLAAAEHRVHEGSVAGSVSMGERALLFDPRTVLEEAVERAAPSARSAGAELRLVDAPGPPLRLVCNRSDLADMLGELLENALKYGKGDGQRGAQVSVSASAHDGVVVIEVADRGPGLSPEERTASTLRFWRSPRHRGTRGSGLGLAIVERLAEANGGRLVLAEGVDGGLAARIEFPSGGDRDA